MLRRRNSRDGGGDSTPPGLKTWATPSFALAAVLFAILAGPVRAADPSGGVIADTYGTIAEITIHYDDDLESELTPLYLDLFSALGPDVYVRVLCRNADEMSRFADAWGVLITSQGRTLELINIGEDLTIWARDRWIARESYDLASPMPSFIPLADAAYERPKFNEIDAGIALADAGLTPPVLDTMLHIEGGNVVASRRHAFVGANIIKENPGVSWESWDVIKHLKRITGRPVIPIQASDGTVPWCHVDMYLTPIDDHLLLVADMNLGLQLRGGPGLMDAVSADDDDGAWETSSPIPDQLDEVTARLLRRGFFVIRLPAIADPAGDWMVTYNNVLMEQLDGLIHVMVPQYDVPALDEFAVATYHALGFRVSTVDVSQVFHLGGALRCIVNVTRRKPPLITTSAVRWPGEIRCYDLSPALNGYARDDSDSEGQSADTGLACPCRPPRR